MNAGTFGDRVQKYLHLNGHSQKELADELGLHPKVLSRKLRESGNAHLTQLEVRRIITSLVQWNAIATRDEVINLLELAGMRLTGFSASEWQNPPLSLLATEHSHPIPSNDASTLASTVLHNVPAPATRLIGREWAVERLQQMLSRDEARLVTLIGPGGSGKTRLALHVASELIGTFAHGVWFVELAGVNHPSLVSMSIIQVLNIKPSPSVSASQSLIAYLRDKHLLLVLDNFEPLLSAAPAVGELLAAAPDLKVLVTSRMTLHLYGERKFSVPPLDVPDPNNLLDTAELAEYGAVQLFVERAQEAVPDFALTAENAASVAQICARLDGLPLALELAAARIKVLSPALLLERLSRARLSMLTVGARNLPSRHQTLRNTITWSYNLLSPAEQTWFLRLGVFTGGWSFEAAEAMMQSVATAQDGTPDSCSSLDILEQLVDSSLLVRVPLAGDQVRFTMLETLREYALERLAEQGELERLRDWHACYFLGLAEAAEIGLRGAQQLVWLARLVAGRDNVRAALDWLLQRARAGTMISSAVLIAFGLASGTREVAGNGPVSSGAVSGTKVLAVELCLRLAAALRPYWEWQGYLAEGRGWLGAVLGIHLDDEAGKTVLAARAKALSEAARLVCLQNEQNKAVELAEESIALWRQLDDAAGLATALLHRGWAAHAMGDYELAKCMYEQGLQLLSPTGDPWLRAQLLFYMAAAAGFTSDFEQMRVYYARSRELFEQLGDKISVADLLKDQGGITILEGKYTEAIDCLLKSITLCYELGHKQFIATGLGSLSFAVGLRGEPEQASASIFSAQLGGAAESLMDAIGLTPWTRTNPLVQMARQLIRSQVEEQSWNAAWAEGRALTIEQAVALARRLGEGTLS